MHEQGPNRAGPRSRRPHGGSALVVRVATWFAVSGLAACGTDAEVAGGAAADATVSDVGSGKVADGAVGGANSAATQLGDALPAGDSVALAGDSGLGDGGAIATGPVDKFPDGGASDVPADMTPGSDSSGSSAADGTPGSDAVPDPTVAFSKTLAGHWVRRTIGNCIDAEEWLMFAPPQGFQQVIVDRDSCGPQSIKKTLGDMKVLPDHTIEYVWNPKDAFNTRRHTAVVVDPWPLPVPQPNGPGYTPGKRAFNRMAYAWNAAANQYKRADRSDTVMPASGALQVRIVTIQLDFGGPLAPVDVPTPCTMTATLNTSWDGGDGSYATGSETFALPCTRTKDPVTGWQRIAANGYENSQTDDSWTKLFEAKGIWKKHKPAVANALYEEFRPLLWVAPGQPAVLFHDVGHAWYIEILNDPPKTL